MRDILALARNIDPAWQAAAAALLLAMIVIASGAVVAWAPYILPTEGRRDAE